MKWALLKKTISGISIEMCSQSPPDVKQLYNQASLLSLNDFSLGAAIDADQVIFRKLTLPITNPQKALAALPFQIETLLPFSPEETSIAAAFFPIRKEGIEVDLFATRKQTLSSIEELAPDYVTTIPQALFRIGQWICKEDTFLILYVGDSKSCFLAGTKERITATHSFSWGHSDFGKESSQKEIERLFKHLKQKNILQEDFPIFLIGENPFALVPEMMKPIDLPYALAIGIALEALADDRNTIQFNRSPLRTEQVKKKYSLTYLATSLAIAISVFSWGKWILHQKEAALTQRLLEQIPPSLIQESTLSANEIPFLLEEWESSLKSKPSSFPFQLTVPTVSDLLAWLSTHPTLTSSDGKKKQEIDIKSVKYRLYKYPKLGESLGPYAVKVDLEFTAETPRIAREFHDSLLKGDAIVNEKQEISWHSQQNTYITSFEMRVKSPGGSL